MADSPPSFWRLDDFDPLYEAWLKIDNPSDELQNIVLGWLAGLADNPYHKGLMRDREMSFLYSGPNPGDTRTGWSIRLPHVLPRCSEPLDQMPLARELVATVL